MKIETSRMRLYLLRHGIARTRSASGRDEDREITEQGAAELITVMRRFRETDTPLPTRILASPYLRAMQTAAIARQELAHPDEIHPSLALTPEASPAQLWDEVRIYADDPVSNVSILLVTHLPLIADATFWMCGKSPAGPRQPRFLPATLVRVDVDPAQRQPSGRLLWSIEP